MIGIYEQFLNWKEPNNQLNDSMEYRINKVY